MWIWSIDFASMYWRTTKQQQSAYSTGIRKLQGALPETAPRPMQLGQIREFMALDDQHFSVVENQGFCQLMAHLDSWYTPARCWYPYLPCMMWSATRSILCILTFFASTFYLIWNSPSALPEWKTARRSPLLCPSPASGPLCRGASCSGPAGWSWPRSAGTQSSRSRTAP